MPGNGPIGLNASAAEGAEGNQMGSGRTHMYEYVTSRMYRVFVLRNMVRGYLRIRCMGVWFDLRHNGNLDQSGLQRIV